MKQKKKTSHPENRQRYDLSRGSRRFFTLPLLAVALTLMVECFNQGTVLKMLGYLAEYPLYFLFNVLIVLTTLSLSELFRHRKAVLFLAVVTWLGLGIGQFFVIKHRTQPFTSMDLLMLGDAITLTTLYYTWPQIILMAAGIIAAAALVITILLRLPKRRHVNYTVGLSIFCVLLTSCFCLGSLGVSFGYYPRYFENLVDAYKQYGFATCFTFTFGEMGVAKPEEYSTETVTDIIEEIDENAEDAAEAAPVPYVFGEADNLSQPNVILLQMESLFDANTIVGSSYSKDPTPNFNRLSREFPSGELYVPSIGGGTANVEFEVLSGMNLDFFGAGEYPYNTVLQENTCETIAYSLLHQGYATTAMHNHTGTFYSRNEVYARLGFEKYVSLEYMPYVTYTDIGWAEDVILTKEIMKAMDATEQRDFVMAITVESHGKYDDHYAYREGDPEILALPEEIHKQKFASYLHLAHATDAFLGNLIETLETYDEPVVLICYGDHLPAFDLTSELLTTENLYASRYVIWNNYGAEFEGRNLQAYQLSAHVLEQLNIPGGVIAKYHQTALENSTKEEYLANLEMLQYDLLYGDRTGYENGENPYKPLNLTMGSVPIEINSVSDSYGRVLVTGKNFTECSQILIDGTPWPTAFVSGSQVVAIVPRTTPVGEVCVAQVTADGTELSRTATWRME